MIGVATLYLCRISPESRELGQYRAMTVRVKVDVTPVVNGLHDLEKQHLPFALAATLTTLVKGAAVKVKGGLHNKFQLRNTFTEQGIRFKPAEKRSEVIEADVHTDTANRRTGAPDYLVKQEDGGERVAFGGRQHIAIPTKYLRQMIGNKPIPAEMRPKALLTAVNGRYTAHTRKGQIALRNQARAQGFVFFLQQAKSGLPMIMGRYWTERDAFPFYILVREVSTRPRLDAEKTVEDYCNAYLEEAWNEQWKKMREAGLRFKS
jgi:hypothetical protein